MVDLQRRFFCRQGDKRWNFERKMFKDYAIEIMRVDSVLLLQISEYSGYGELDRSRYDMEPLIVLEQNGAHFFSLPLDLIRITNKNESVHK